MLSPCSEAWANVLRSVLSVPHTASVTSERQHAFQGGCRQKATIEQAFRGRPTASQVAEEQVCLGFVNGTLQISNEYGWRYPVINERASEACGWHAMCRLKAAFPQSLQAVVDWSPNISKAFTCSSWNSLPPAFESSCGVVLGCSAKRVSLGAASSTFAGVELDALHKGCPDARQGP